MADTMGIVEQIDGAQARNSSAATPVLSPEREGQAQALNDWLLGEARAHPCPESLLGAIGERFLAAGLPVDRLMVAVSVLHSERSGYGRFWEPGAQVRTEFFPFGETADALYERSPFRQAHETGDWVDLKLDETHDDAFGIIPELKAQGFTHYICVPVLHPDGSQNGVTFATKRKGGFGAEDCALLRAVLPALRVLMEIVSLRRVLDDVLGLYVGAEPQKRILKGQIRRGDVVHIRSAILFADMRGFTSLSMGMNAGELVELLNGYYDCIVPRIEAHGGEVLEFIGDGVLAIFRCEGEQCDGGAGERSACTDAFAAACEALQAVAARNAGQPDAAYDVGIALHYGRAAYGNIGSGTRLDYTVIGRDVNLASRIAGLCSTLAHPLLVSKAFRDNLPACQVTSIGEHTLKGVADPHEIFMPLGEGMECPEG
ncbi:MAG: adenylate/guanylate cyclase domain-containing protein [Hyphomicrobiales bacterium]|nr:adenylate/guanylate cyclase domain-containing protein [Hyphomicrobiales bacterium]